jgi:hypothetical protein
MYEAGEIQVIFLGYERSAHLAREEVLRRRGIL